MKRLNSSDEQPLTDRKVCVLGTEEKGRNRTQIYSRDQFQAMLHGFDQDECVGEAEELGGTVSDKKRRLSSDQAKALEKNFEVENKLDPERKSQLAEELGLQPRQVSIWFQNRRARFKTKQLERDYGILKTGYDALKIDFENLELKNEALLAEVRKLKETAICFAAAAMEGEESPASASVTNAVAINGVDKELDILGDVIKEDSTQYEDGELLTASSPFLNWIQFSNSRAAAAVAAEQQRFGNPEASCSFLSVDHAPTLQWYLPQ